MTEKLLHSNITEKIIQSFFTVSKNLPNGLSTEVYRNALSIEFELNNLQVKKDYSIELKYRGVQIGEMLVDFLIDKKVLVKVVSVDTINKQIEDESKIGLRISSIEVCMILNFNGDNEYKRVIFTNDFKKNH